MSIEDRLKELGYALPDLRPPAANFIPVKIAGNLAFVSGHGPVDEDGVVRVRGKLGKDLTVEDGYAAARKAALGCLASLARCFGGLDRIRGVVKLVGFVNSTESFIDQPKVVNGASDLLVSVFGERGKHARSAVGMASLPNNIPVEIELVVEFD